MQDPFDEFGFWWLPEEPTEQKAGRLSFDPRRGGCLEIYLADVPFSKKEDLKDYPIIFGNTVAGNRYTLLSSFDTLVRRPGTGTESRTIHTNHIIKGLHLPAPDTQWIRRAYVAYDLLFPWAMQSGFTVRDQESPLDYEVRFKTPETVAFALDDGLRLELTSLPTHIPLQVDTNGNLTLREKARFCLLPAEPISYETALELLSPLQDLLALCGRRSCSLSELTVETTTEISRGSLMDVQLQHAEVLFATPRPSEECVPSNRWEFLFTYHDLAASFAMIVNQWFRDRHVLLPVRALYNAMLRASRELSPARFLNTVQALEVFHRRMIGGTFVEPMVYEKDVLPNLISALPSVMDEGDKAVLANRLRVLNELTLRRRIRDLIARHSDLMEDLGLRENQMVNEAVELRNVFTHYHDPTKDMQPDHRSFWRLVEGLQLLLEACVAERIGISPTEFRKYALRCHRVVQHFNW